MPSFLQLTRLSLVTLVAVLGFQNLKAQTLSGYAIAKRMFEHTPTIKSAAYLIKKQERIEGKMTTQVSYTKVVKKPFQVYIRQKLPNDGQEVLYVQGQNNDKAIINPNGFPWINLKLNPMENIMRNNQHHTIFQSGFDYVVSILAYLCEKYEAEVEKLVTNNGDVIFAGRPCYSISFANPKYQWINYQIKQNETITDIAEKYMLTEQMILERNPTVSNAEDVQNGQNISIPNAYSPKMNLLIDKKYLVPVKMEVYDDRGLYEQYEYRNIKINPTFDPNEFSAEYKNYQF